MLSGLELHFKFSFHYSAFKGCYLDFSHPTDLKYIAESYMKKQYKSSIIKNYKITKKFFLIAFPLTHYQTTKL